MIDDQAVQAFSGLCDQARIIVVVQANNPDGDSLAASLALESWLGELGKTVVLYCGAPIPNYLHFLSGYDRVLSQLPNNYDLAIMVDNSAQKLVDDNVLAKLGKRPLVIIDHHPTPSDISGVQLCLNYPEMAATGQVIYQLGQQAGWELSSTTAGYLASSLLSDTLGFTSQAMAANPRPLEIMADLVRHGVDLAQLHDRRLQSQKIDHDLIAYKGQLLERIEFFDGGRLASLTVKSSELKQFGARYNPTIVLDDLRLVKGVRLTIGFKEYEDGQGQVTRLTARLRCHEGSQVAGALAEQFGGGGHPYAAGIKWLGPGLDVTSIKTRVYQAAGELLDQER